MTPTGLALPSIERFVQAQHDPQSILDLSEGTEHAKWFPGMQLNIALSCFSGRDPNALALIWSDESEQLHQMTLGELEVQSHQVAWSLRQAGFHPGDAIAVDMPMTSESVVVYLGCVLAGCIVVSIADSFAPNEIQTRLEISKAKGIFTQDVIVRGGKSLPLYERVLEAQAPRAIVLPAGDTLAVPLREGDLVWSEFLSGQEEAPIRCLFFPPRLPPTSCFPLGRPGRPRPSAGPTSPQSKPLQMDGHTMTSKPGTWSRGQPTWVG